MSHPAIRVVEAACRLLSAPRQAFGEVEHRDVELGEVRDLGRPVVHLQVDVDVVVGVPRCLDVLVPESLQVRGQRAGSTAGDEQVAGVLEVEREQRRVLATRRQLLESYVGGLRGLGSRAEIDGDAFHHRSEARDVSSEEVVEVAPDGRVHPAEDGFARRLEDRPRIRTTVSPDRRDAGRVVGRGGDEHGVGTTRVFEGAVVDRFVDPMGDRRRPLDPGVLAVDGPAGVHPHDAIGRHDRLALDAADRRQAAPMPGDEALGILGLPVHDDHLVGFARKHPAPHAMTVGDEARLRHAGREVERASIVADRLEVRADPGLDRPESLVTPDESFAHELVLHISWAATTSPSNQSRRAFSRAPADGSR